MRKRLLPILLSLLLLHGGCSVAGRVETLFSRDENSKLNQPAKVDEFVALGRSAIPALVAALKSKSPRRRALATAALGRFRSRRELKPLLELANDPSADVRRVLAIALGEIGSDVVISPLKKLLEDREAPVRAAAVWAVGHLNQVAALDELVSAFVTGPEVVRDMAIWALPRLLATKGTAELPALLRKSLDAEDETLRVATLRLFEYLGDKRVLRQVERIVGDPDQSLALRRVGLVYLARHGDGISLRLFPALLAEQEVELRSAVYRALYLRRRSPVALVLLLRGLREEDEWRRDEVVDVLLNRLGLRRVAKRDAATLLPLVTGWFQRWRREAETPTRADEALLASALLGDPGVLPQTRQRLLSARGRERLFLAAVGLQLKPTPALLKSLSGVAASLSRRERLAFLGLLGASPHIADHAGIMVELLAADDKKLLRRAIEIVGSKKLVRPKVLVGVMMAVTHADSGARRRAERVLSRASGQQLNALVASASAALAAADATSRPRLLRAVVLLPPSAEVEKLLLREFERDDQAAATVLTVAVAFKRRRALAQKALAALRSESLALRTAALNFLQLITGKRFGPDQTPQWKDALSRLK